MAGQSRIYQLNILANTKGLVDGLDKANKEVSGAGSKMGETFKKVGVAVAAAGVAAGAFAVKFGVEAVKAASDLNETLAKSGEIFGAGAKQVEAFAASAASSLGQSKQQALDAAATFGIFGKSAGLAGEDLVKFSTDFVALAGDLASFNNTTPEEAITAIGSALRGEAEPLRRFGVLLDDATLRAAALELGIVSTTKNALTPQQKVLAAQAVIYKQTGDAQGDFARTSEGLANQQRILTAQIENVKTSIGTALLPVATELFSFIGGKLIPIMTNFSDSFSEQAAPAIETLRKVVIDFVLPALKNLWGFITEFVIPTLRNVFTPVIEIVQAAFVFLSKKVKENQEAFETAAAIMLKIFEFVRDKLAPVVGNVLATAFNIITRAIGLAIDNFGRVFDIINKVARFLGFDFSLEVDKATKTVNNLDSGIVDAYKSFSEQSRVVKQEVIPSLNSVVTAQNSVAASTTRTTAAINEQTRASEALARIQKKLADDPTGEKAVAAARAARGTGERISLTERQRLEALATSGTLSLEEESRLVAALTGSEYDPSTTGRYVARLSDLLDVGLGGVSSKIIDEALIGLVKEGLLTPGINGQPTYQPAGGGSLGELVAGRVNQINININGTVVNPEGTARAITNVLQNSNARSGVGVLTPVLGLE